VEVEIWEKKSQNYFFLLSLWESVSGGIGVTEFGSERLNPLRPEVYFVTKIRMQKILVILGLY
jgi:hypothetical protein